MSLETLKSTFQTAFNLLNHTMADQTQQQPSPIESESRTSAGFIESAEDAHKHRCVTEVNISITLEVYL